MVLSTKILFPPCSSRYLLRYCRLKIIETSMIAVPPSLTLVTWSGELFFHIVPRQNSPFVKEGP